MVGPLRVARDDLERKLKAAKKELSEQKEDAKQKAKKIQLLEGDKESLQKRLAGGGAAAARRGPVPPPAKRGKLAATEKAGAAASAAPSAQTQQQYTELASLHDAKAKRLEEVLADNKAMEERVKAATAEKYLIDKRVEIEVTKKVEQEKKKLKVEFDSAVRKMGRKQQQQAATAATTAMAEIP